MREKTAVRTGALAVTAVSAALPVLYRSLMHGELPKAISGRGAEWSEIAVKATSATDRLQLQIDTLRDDLRALRRTLPAPDPSHERE